MLNRVEINEEMMVMVNGGRPITSVGNPYSTNAPMNTMPGMKKENEAK